jgi:hypothetical protein
MIDFHLTTGRPASVLHCFCQRAPTARGGGGGPARAHTTQSPRLSRSPGRRRLAIIKSGRVGRADRGRGPKLMVEGNEFCLLPRAGRARRCTANATAAAPHDKRATATIMINSISAYRSFIEKQSNGQSRGREFVKLSRLSTAREHHHERARTGCWRSAERAGAVGRELPAGRRYVS